MTNQRLLLIASTAVLARAYDSYYVDPYVEAYMAAIAAGRYPWTTPDPMERNIVCSGLAEMSFCDCDGDCTQNPSFCDCLEAQECCNSGEAPEPSTCTPQDGDPWSTGTFVPCCGGDASQECLREDAGWAYRCQPCSQECPDDSDWNSKCASAEASLPAPPGPSGNDSEEEEQAEQGGPSSDGPSPGEEDSCTPEFSDPYSSGSFLRCCGGDEFQPCLRADRGWAYACNSCAEECSDDSEWNTKCAKALPAPTPLPVPPPTPSPIPALPAPTPLPVPPPTPSPIPAFNPVASSKCTEALGDPWSTGEFVPCCGGEQYQPCLHENLGWTYRCQVCGYIFLGQPGVGGDACSDDPEWATKCGFAELPAPPGPSVNEEVEESGEPSSDGPPASEGEEGGCTPEFEDPWKTGSFVPCCGYPVLNYQPCLEASAGWTYRCKLCSTSCPDDPDWNTKCRSSEPSSLPAPPGSPSGLPEEASH